MSYQLDFCDIDLNSLKSIENVFAYKESTQSISGTSYYNRAPKRVTFYIRHDGSAFLQDIIDNNCDSYREIADYTMRISEDNVPVFTGILDLTSVDYVKKTRRIYMRLYDKLKLFETFKDILYIPPDVPTTYLAPPTRITEQELKNLFNTDIVRDKFSRITMDMSNMSSFPENFVDNVDILYIYPHKRFRKAGMPPIVASSILTQYIRRGFRSFTYKYLSHPAIENYYQTFIHSGFRRYNDPAFPDEERYCTYVDVYLIFNMTQFKLIHSFDIIGTYTNIGHNYTWEVQKQVDYALVHQNDFAVDWIGSLQASSFTDQYELPDEINGTLHCPVEWLDSDYSQRGYIKFTGNMFAHWLYIGERMEKRYQQGVGFVDAGDRLERSFLVTNAIIGTLNYYNNTLYSAPNGFIWTMNKSDFGSQDIITIDDVDVSGLRYGIRSMETIPNGSLSFLAGDTEIAETQLNEYLEIVLHGTKYITCGIKWIIKYPLFLFSRIKVKGKNYKIESIRQNEKMNKYIIKAGEI